MGSMSRSKMADEEECTEVGDEGIEAGDREPRRPVRRCCDVRFESLFSLVVLARLVADVM